MSDFLGIIPTGCDRALLGQALALSGASSGTEIAQLTLKTIKTILVGFSIVTSTNVNEWNSWIVATGRMSWVTSTEISISFSSFCGVHTFCMCDYFVGPYLWSPKFTSAFNLILHQNTSVDHGRISIIPIPATKALHSGISSTNAIVHNRRSTTFENDPSFERSQLVADNQFGQILQLCHRFVESYRMKNAMSSFTFLLPLCSCLFCGVGIRLGWAWYYSISQNHLWDFQYSRSDKR